MCCRAGACGGLPGEEASLEFLSISAKALERCSSKMSSLERGKAPEDEDPPSSPPDTLNPLEGIKLTPFRCPVKAAAVLPGGDVGGEADCFPCWNSEISMGIGKRGNGAALPLCMASCGFPLFPLEAAEAGEEGGEAALPSPTREEAPEALEGGRSAGVDAGAAACADAKEAVSGAASTADESALVERLLLAVALTVAFDPSFVPLIEAAEVAGLAALVVATAAVLEEAASCFTEVAAAGVVEVTAGFGADTVA